MASTFAVTRNHLIFGLCLPLAVLMGYVLAEPLACVVDSLRACSTWEEALGSLPDVGRDDFARLGLTAREA